MRRTRHCTLLAPTGRIDRAPIGLARSGLGVLTALALAACASNAARFSPISGKSFPPRDASFEVAVFDSVLPASAFERIARLDVQMQMSSAEDASLQDAIPELKRQARLAGADAIIDIRLQRSKAGDMTLFQVSAMAIRYMPNPGLRNSPN